MEKAIFDPGYRAVLKWFYEARMQRGLSMRDLGELIGEPHTVVQKVESGDRRLDIYEYKRYCEALEIDPVIGLRMMD